MTKQINLQKLLENYETCLALGAETVKTRNLVLQLQYIASNAPPHSAALQKLLENYETCLALGAETIKTHNIVLQLQQVLQNN